ncbi:hypothetical protein llap_8907 [Limosa lapponica baueri]|uniref:Uncharacterized protein n=1 Tax=Limosa lapponica baueri TaxID=1758121 RepID=A0A2I0U405_LIMLA|nr:hypothetical protein llap_8907 [Limosa lapponica baueri]
MANLIRKEDCHGPARDFTSVEGLFDNLFLGNSCQFEDVLEREKEQEREKKNEREKEKEGGRKRKKEGKKEGRKERRKEERKEGRRIIKYSPFISIWN